MWGDSFIISPLLGVIVAWYDTRWSFSQIIFALSVGITMSGVMHILYLHSDTPQAHIRNGRLTPAGWGHAWYMAFALSIFVLFYFFTPQPNPVFLYTTSLLILFHVMLGTHVVLAIIAPRWYPDQPLKDIATWLTLGGSAATILWRMLSIG
jgi:hypothetical protein